MPPEVVRIADLLAGALRAGMARLDAQRLLLAALGGHPHDRAWLLAHDTDAVPLAAAEQFQTLCERLREGEPVAYLLGRQDFYGLTLQVDARVLIPRPDTETLVTWAIEQLQPAACMLDLGTGSGAIALAVRKARPDVDVEAVDASEAALAVARANAARLSLDVRFRQACWLAGAGHYDVIVSNPPYVAEGDPHLAGLLHEPRAALVAGLHGLADLSHIAAASPRHLTRGGWLLLEHGWDQAAAVRQLLVENGFTRVSSRCDLAGIERCSGGQWLELG